MEVAPVFGPGFRWEGRKLKSHKNRPSDCAPHNVNLEPKRFLYSISHHLQKHLFM